MNGNRVTMTSKSRNAHVVEILPNRRNDSPEAGFGTNCACSTEIKVVNLSKHNPLHVIQPHRRGIGVRTIGNAVPAITDLEYQNGSHD